MSPDAFQKSASFINFAMFENSTNGSGRQSLRVIQFFSQQGAIYDGLAIVRLDYSEIGTEGSSVVKALSTEH